MEQKCIAVIAAYRYTSQFLAEEIKKLFEPQEEVRVLYLDEEERGRPSAEEYYTQRIREFDLDHCSMILYSSETVRGMVERVRRPEAAAVVSRRNVELSKLPEIVSIQSGTTVYAFGSSREAALELIGELRETGIGHLNLLPWYPGSGVIRPDIVITPGKIFPQMREARRIIDVEFRHLRISTVMEIFMALNLPAENLFSVEAWYQGEIRSLNRYNTTINKSMTGILESINEGIFCVDETGRVLFCNRIFLNLTGTDYYDVAGKHFQEISFGPELMSIVNYEGELFSDIVEYGEKKLLVNRQKNPGDAAGFIISIQDVTRISEIETDVRKKLAQKGFVAKYSLDRLIGESPVIQGKIAEARKVAASDHTVLLTGDNGTGKEMFAQAIHNESSRARHPFVAVNLASLSDAIIESEIFGYEEGAFTGALKGGKPGLFEMAHNGTIFIDEIGDVSPHIQQRLLRVLQEREVMRVGGNRVIPVNVRVIAATNRNLFEMVQAGKFRMDLYYRLKVLHIHVPRLAERREDIPLFLEHFFREVKSAKRVSPQALAVLQEYPWPGNVRELQNLVYYLETLCERETVRPEDLPEEFAPFVQKGARRGAAGPETEDGAGAAASSAGAPGGGEPAVSVPDGGEPAAGARGDVPGDAPGSGRRVHPEDTDPAEFGAVSGFLTITRSSSPGDIEDFYFILEQLRLAAQTGVSLGRNRLCRMSEERAAGPLTVEQLRGRMKKLERWGMILVGKTRQGSSITQTGEIFLKWLEATGQAGGRMGGR